MSEEVTPEAGSEIAAILSKGVLRYRKSSRLRAAEPPQNSLDSGAEPSRHVTVVNAERTDQN